MTATEKILLQNKPLIFKLKKHEIKNFIEKNKYQLKEEEEFYKIVKYIEKENNNIYDYIHEMADWINQSRIVSQQYIHNRKISKMKRCQSRKENRATITRKKLFKYYLEKYCSIFTES